MRTRGSALHTCWIALVLAAPAIAHAESAAPACYDGNAYPYGGNVPANIPSFLVEAQGWTTAGIENVQLVRVTGTTEVPVDVEVTRHEVSNASFPLTQYVIVPAAPLVPGEHVLRFDPCAWDGAPTERRYNVIDAVPLPDAPLTVTLEAQAIVRGSRISQHRVLAHLDAASAPLAPWRGVLAHDVWIGPVQSSVPAIVAGGRMTFQITLECDRAYSGGPLVEGTHEVRGSFAGLGLEPFVQTTSSATVDCDDVTYVRPDGTPLTEEEIAAIDRTPPPAVVLDAASGALDGGAGASDAGAIDPDTMRSGPEPASSCSVAPGARGASLAALALAALAIVLAARRSRRHALGDQAIRR